MIALLALHALAAIVAPVLVQRWGPKAFLVLALVPASAAVWALTTMPAVIRGEAVVESVPWVPGFGLNFDTRIDGLALVLTLVVTVVGALVLAYCAAYFKASEPGLGRFAGVFTAFAGAMLLLVTTDNVVMLFIGWELTTIFSFLMIGHHAAKRPSRRAAIEALIVTTFGGLAMLAGLLMLAQVAGSAKLSVILASDIFGPQASSLVTTAVVLVLVGALSKSAIFPFQFWLPNAMAAPTPVSAYLHAAAMVKAGVYLVARMAPAVHEVPLWLPLVWTFGCLTMVMGAWQALRQTDIKLMLAYGTVSQLGFLVAINGTGTPAAALAGVVLLVGHACFKAPLFLVVGMIDKATGTRDLRVLSGVGRRNPVVALIAIISAASMAAVPPMFGFVAKEAAYASLLHGGATEYVLLGFLVAGSVLTVAYSARFVWGALFTKHLPRRPGVSPRSVRPVAMKPISVRWWWPALPLVLTTLILAWVPWLVEDLVADLVAQYDPDLPHGHLALWPGINLAFGLSLLTLALGALLIWQAKRVAVAQYRLSPRRRDGQPLLDADRGYRRLMRGVDTVAVYVTGATQRGSLPSFIATVLGVVVLIPGTLLLRGWPARITVHAWDTIGQVAIGAVIAVAAVAAARSRRRLRAVVLAGVAGYGVAGLFALHGAPDLALTQVVVETVTLVVFVLVFRRLPIYFSKRPLRASRWLRMMLAVAVAVVICGFAIAAGSSRTTEPVGPQMIEPAYSQGHGRNVVNVTLVDMRAWDTMGEISVIVVAATGTASLVFVRRRDSTLVRARDVDADALEVWGGEQTPALVEQGESAHEHRSRTWLTATNTLAPRRRSVLLEVTTRLLFPLMMLFALYLLFAGHNNPGGGFAAGLVAGLGFTLRYLAGGRFELTESAPVHPGAVLGTGLLIALAAGLAPVAVGGTILQSATLDFWLPIWGEVHLVTAMFFDIGVFLVVIGLVLDILTSLGSEIDRHLEHPEWYAGLEES